MCDWIFLFLDTVSLLIVIILKYNQMAVLGGMLTTVLGSKRSAICALAVYFVHSTRPKIQGLVSHDSIVDRQFVIACVRYGVTNIRFMYRALPSTVVQRRTKSGRLLVRSVYRSAE